MIRWKLAINPEAHSGRVWPAVLVLLLANVGIYSIFPWVKILKARQWPQVLCVIQSAEIGTGQSGGETVYFPKVKFIYGFQGREYRSDHYSIIDFKTPKKSEIQNILDRLTSASMDLHLYCFVDPENPAWAVLNRDSQMLVSFPFLFMIVTFGSGFLFLFIINMPRFFRYTKSSHGSLTPPQIKGIFFFDTRLIPFLLVGFAWYLVGLLVVWLNYNVVKQEPLPLLSKAIFLFGPLLLVFYPLGKILHIKK